MLRVKKQLKLLLMKKWAVHRVSIKWYILVSMGSLTESSWSIVIEFLFQSKVEKRTIMLVFSMLFEKLLLKPRHKLLTKNWNYSRLVRMIYFLSGKHTDHFILSWLREEDFDETTSSFESTDNPLHSVVYSDIKPMLLNVTVLFPFLSSLAFSLSRSSGAFTTLSRGLVSISLVSTLSKGTWNYCGRWWRVDSSSSSWKWSQYGANGNRSNFCIKWSFCRSTSSASSKMSEFFCHIDSKSFPMVYLPFYKSISFDLIVS